MVMDGKTFIQYNKAQTEFVVHRTADSSRFGNTPKEVCEGLDKANRFLYLSVPDYEVPSWMINKAYDVSKLLREYPNL